MKDVNKSDERLTLLWLAMAVTMPQHACERFYYDSRSKLCFSNSTTVGGLKLVDKANMPLPVEIGSDIAVRLEWVSDQSSEIIEIPRLNVADKVDIQLHFLSNFDGVMHIQELIKAVENQKDDYKMVLDTILIENSTTAPMAYYWDDFKLSHVVTYIEMFTKAIGLEISF
jgi:hypothetical protein